VSEHAGCTVGVFGVGVNPLTLPGTQGPTSTTTSADVPASLEASDFTEPESAGSTFVLGEEQAMAKPDVTTISAAPRGALQRTFTRLVSDPKVDLASREKETCSFRLAEPAQKARGRSAKQSAIAILSHRIVI
jgi:hypothetical protein